MPDLHEISGRVVDLRRHTNVHLYWRGRCGPAERYDLWLRDAVGCEFQFIIHTRTMPTRRGHEITLLIDADQVRGLVNWSTGQSVNYLSTDPPPLWRMRDLLAPPVLIALLSAWRSELALLLFLPTTFLYFLIAPIIRGAVRIWRSAAVGHVLRDVQRAGSGYRSPATRRRPD